MDLLFYQVTSGLYYFTGGPYLSESGEDDCYRDKKIPLYLND